jgi:hypothetical protein
MSPSQWDHDAAAIHQNLRSGTLLRPYRFGQCAISIRSPRTKPQSSRSSCHEPIRRQSAADVVVLMRFCGLSATRCFLVGCCIRVTPCLLRSDMLSPQAGSTAMFEVYLNGNGALLVVPEGLPIPNSEIGRWRKKTKVAAVSEEIRLAIQRDGYYRRRLGEPISTYKRIAARS